MKKNLSREQGQTSSDNLTHDTRKKGTRPYRKPSIETFTGRQILEEIGPAQGYSGGISGVDNPF